MPSQLLVNVITVTVPATGSVTVPHGLRSNDKPVAPKLVLPSGSPALTVGTITDTTIEFINGTEAPITATFRVERGLSMEVDAADLSTVVVGSGVNGTSGIADALQPTRSDSTYTLAWVPVYPSADPGLPPHVYIVGTEGTGVTIGAGPIENEGGNMAGPHMWFGGFGPGNREIRIFTGLAEGSGYERSEVRMEQTGITFVAGYDPAITESEAYVQINNGGILLSAPTVLGAQKDVSLFGEVINFAGLANTSDTQTPVAGTPIPVITNSIGLSSLVPVNMNGTLPQLKVVKQSSGDPIPAGTQITVYNTGVGAITLTNAVGGQMKLRTSPLVINQFEAYDFIFDGTYWVQRG